MLTFRQEGMANSVHQQVTVGGDQTGVGTKRLCGVWGEAYETANELSPESSKHDLQVSHATHTLGPPTFGLFTPVVCKTIAFTCKSCVLL